jgi:hypothetical protein
MRNQRRWSRSGYFLLTVILIFAALTPGLDFAQAQDGESPPPLICGTNEFQIQGQEWGGGPRISLRSVTPAIVDYAGCRAFAQTTL